MKIILTALVQFVLLVLEEIDIICRLFFWD